MANSTISFLKHSFHFTPLLTESRCGHVVVLSSHSHALPSAGHVPNGGRSDRFTTRTGFSFSLPLRFTTERTLFQARGVNVNECEYNHGANCAPHKSDLRNWKNWNHFSEMVVAKNNSPRNRQERRRSLLLVGRHEFQSESFSLSLSLLSSGSPSQLVSHKLEVLETAPELLNELMNSFWAGSFTDPWTNSWTDSLLPTPAPAPESGESKLRIQVRSIANY